MRNISISNRFWKNTLSIVGISRFLTVFTVFSSPLLAIILAHLLDAFDSIFAYKANYTWKKYTRYDKLLDYWWYIFILIYSFGKPIWQIVLILFLIRSVGQILVLITSKHEYLFWFPNILEHYFVLYVLALAIFPQFLYYFEGSQIIWPLLIATITKMPQEYILHVKGWFYESNSWPKSIITIFNK